ncbi:MAG: glycosyltransferase family 39 protein [Candidatus Moranbacteria bacterium]|nr:glycosyltransferase family 39 protein [Candidatus Moranbacteria bacterium]
MAFLSIFIAGNTLFFVALQVESLTLLRLPLTENTLFYFCFVAGAIGTIGIVAYFSEKFFFWSWLAKILVVWLPTIIILVYGFSESKNFHAVFLIAIGGYVILAGLLASFHFIEKERPHQKIDSEALPCKKWFRTQGLPTLLLVIFSTALFFSFGAYRLTEYAAVDEPLWFDGRIAKYWKNVGELDWGGTSISDKPGITIALAAGPGLWFKSTKEYRTVHHQGEVYNLKNDVEAFYLAYRLPLLIVITLLLPLFYFFLERLVGRRNALFSYVLLATSPVLLGISKIINPDSLLWIFAPLSLITYLVFLQRKSFRYLIFSGIFLGLALLTKYVANILFIFFLGLIFLEYLFHHKNENIAFVDYLKKSLQYIALLSFTALTTFYVLFPAVWVKPEKLLEGTIFSQAFEKVAPLFLILILTILFDQWFNKTRLTTALFSILEKGRRLLPISIGLIFLGSILVVVVDVISGMQPYHFMELLASPKTIATKSDFLGAFFTNFYPFIFGVTPLVFFGLLITPFFFFRRSFTESVALRTSFYFVIFILLYYFGTTVNDVAAIVRYQIILFPLGAIIGGVALEHLCVLLHKKFAFKNMPSPVISASLFLGIGITILLFTPFPLSYASSLLPAKYHIDVKDMGAGSFEAAQYLNSLPKAKDMLIWTDKDGVCKFFVGRCKRGLDYQKLRSEGLDYIVVSAGREKRTTGMMGGAIQNNKPGIIRFDEYYKRTDTKHVIEINKRPSHFVKIFKFEL